MINLFSYYGLGIVRKETLFEVYGFKKKKNLKEYLENKDNDNLKNQNQVLDLIKKNILLNLKKPEVVLKEKRDAIDKKIKNGSYKGYRYSLGYPMYNQRTRTNGKTAKKKKI